MIMRLTVILLMMGTMSTAKYMEGDLNSGDNWVFIARFCFLSMDGRFEYDVEYPEVSEDMIFTLYYMARFRTILFKILTSTIPFLVVLNLLLINLVKFFFFINSFFIMLL